MDVDDNIHIINTVDENDNKYAMMNGGINPQAEMVLETLGIKQSDVQRFRDAGYDKHSKMIWLLARTGIDNAFPDLNNNSLTENKHFLTRFNEPYDQTYELFMFRPHVRYLEFKHVPTPNMRWILKQSLKRLESGQLNELEQTFVNQLNESLNGE